MERVHCQIWSALIECIQPAQCGKWNFEEEQLVAKLDYVGIFFRKQLAVSSM